MLAGAAHFHFPSELACRPYRPRDNQKNKYN